MNDFWWHAWMAVCILFWFGWGRMAMLNGSGMQHARQVTGTMFLMCVLFGVFTLPERLDNQTLAQFDAGQVRHWAKWAARSGAAVIGTLTAWRKHGSKPLKYRASFPGV